jgi:DNA-binding MarR family transcriptional regulator
MVSTILSSIKYAHLPITAIADVTGLTVPEVSSAINLLLKEGKVCFVKRNASLHYKAN